MIHNFQWMILPKQSEWILTAGVKILPEIAVRMAEYV